jgi:Prealbumin-like fold domain
MAAKTRTRFVGLLVGVGVLALGLGGTLVAVAVTPGVPAAAPARSDGQGAAARLTATTTLDHFTCYIASAAKSSTGASTFGQPSAVQLANQFAPQGLWSAVGNVAFHCNPVAKTANGAVTPITNPNAHLLCFTTPPTPAAAVVTQPTYKVSVSNQFGSAELDTKQPVLLCLPTWKSLTGPPNQTQVQPPGLDHFLCYAASVDPNSPTQFAPPPVLLQDQFMPKPVKATVLTPNLLCLPTAKALSPLVGAPTVNYNDPHLVCFALKVGAVRAPTVFDQNQFGTGAVAIKKLTELCVPSTKQVVSPGGQIVITKTDEAGIPLMGATFTAYAPTDPTMTTPLGSCTTGAAGVCTIANLAAPDSYIVAETTPPSGYTAGPAQTVTITTSPGAASVTFTDCPPTVGAGCSPAGDGSRI